MPVVTVDVWQDAVDGILEFIDLLGQPATILEPDLKAPKAGSTRGKRSFKIFAQVSKMAFDTESGVKVFNGVGTERIFDTTAFMEYIPNVTSKLLVLFNGNRYKIRNSEDIGLINGVLSLELELLGDSQKGASES